MENKYPPENIEQLVKDLLFEWIQKSEPNKEKLLKNDLKKFNDEKWQKEQSRYLFDFYLKDKFKKIFQDELQYESTCPFCYADQECQYDE